MWSVLLGGLILAAQDGVSTQPVVLNNLVTLLVETDVAEEDGVVSFENPREGWIHVSAAAPGDAPDLRLDDDEDPLVWRVPPGFPLSEAMRYLSAGPHVLRGKGPYHVKVRAIPELAFCYYPSNQHIEAFPDYDWTFLDQQVLWNVNVLVTHGNVPPEEFKQWTKEGRRWISNAALPGLGGPAPSVAEVADLWLKNAGAREDGYAGLIVDEFIDASPEHYQAWGEALKQLYLEDAFRGRTFYAWCGNLFEQPQSLDFAKLLAGFNGRFVWEKYMCEWPSESAAQQWIRSAMGGDMREWEEVMPNAAERTMVCLGYMSAPPESLNVLPDVDYMTLLDLQFYHLATTSSFKNLYGIMMYMAAYADIEAVIYAHQLFRHYAIEGSREHFTQNPYKLRHLRNPDFASGLEFWKVTPAIEGSVTTETMEGFSWLQGRYPRTTQGDQFCVMTRNAAKPNRIQQTIRGLEPGRAYSLKVISADLSALDKKQEIALDIQIDGAQILDDMKIDQPISSCYSHEVEPYTKDHPAWFNYHWRVFVPEGIKADLTIEDWADSGKPGGPDGQRIAFNFVEVMPFILGKAE